MDYPAHVAAFQNGAAGFMCNGAWEVPTFNDAELDYDVMPFPNILGSNATQGDNHAFVVPISQSRSPERLDAAIQFISEMLDRSLTWAGGGHIPAWQPTVTSQEYKDLKPQSNYAQVAADIVPNPVAWFGGAGSDLEAEAWAAFQTVFNGAPPERGLRQFKSALQDFLDKPAPVTL